jgi:hypothetical protein
MSTPLNVPGKQIWLWNFGFQLMKTGGIASFANALAIH